MNPNYLGLIEKINWLIPQVERLCCKVAALQAQNNSATESIVQFTIGDGGPLTPPDGTSTYGNHILEGTTPYPFVNGGNFLRLGFDYTFNSVTGVITLINGLVFNTGETWTIFY